MPHCHGILPCAAVCLPSPWALLVLTWALPRGSELPFPGKVLYPVSGALRGSGCPKPQHLPQAVVPPTAFPAVLCPADTPSSAGQARAWGCWLEAAREWTFGVGGLPGAHTGQGLQPGWSGLRGSGRGYSHRPGIPAQQPGQMGFGVCCSQSRPEPRRGSDQVAGSRTAGRLWKELASPSLSRPSSLPPLSSQGSTKWLPHHPPFCDPGRGGSLAGGGSEETTTQRPGWSQQQPPPPPSLGCNYTGAGARLRFGKAEPGVLATALPAWSRGHPGPGTTKQTSQ